MPTWKANRKLIIFHGYIGVGTVRVGGRSNHGTREGLGKAHVDES